MGSVGRLALLAVFVAALAWPGAAFAASGSLVGGVMDYTADPGESNNIVFTTNDVGEPTFEVQDAPGVVIAAASPCFNGASQNIMECPQDGNGSGAITLLTASLGDGNDTITLQANLPTSIGAGGGTDTMNSGQVAAALR